MLYVYNMTDKYFLNTCSGRQCFLTANQIVHLTKIRVVKSQVAMLVVSSATLKFVYVFLIWTNILPLNKQNKLNLAISLKVIPQYCTGHPVLRIKIT